MKRIYIRENTLANIVGGNLLPSFLYKMVKGHNTSLGDNEAFPPSGDYPFDYLILKERFQEVIDALNEFGYEGYSEDDLISELSSLVKETKEIERPVRNALEMICENALNRLFAIPKESINMTFKLVDKVKFKGGVRVTPEGDEETKYSFKDIADIDLSNKAIGKRRFVDALVQGASYTLSNIEGLYVDDIERINPRLLRLYRKIRVINDYLLFTKKEKITDDNPMQGAYVETHLGMDNTKTSIKAQGLIFPLLFQEAVKGLFELSSSHGLPKDKKKAEYIVKKADFILAEPWDLRLGVTLWKKIFGDIEDTNMIPYVFTSYVKIPTDEFNAMSKEILANTERGNEFMEELIVNAEHDKDYQEFTNRINARNLEKALIQDSYFSGADANGYELSDNDEDGDIISEED